MGLTPGSGVGFLGKNSIEFFEAWFAASEIRCPVVPLNWRSAPEELLALLKDASPSVLFVSEEFYEVILQLRQRTSVEFEVVRFDPSADDLGDAPDSQLAGESETLSDCRATAGDIALRTYTSGTTGRPKGVEATQEAFQFSFLCSCLEPTLQFTPDDILLMAMPNFHLGGSWVSLGALYFGAAVSIIPAFDIELFLAALRRDRPTVLPLVPTAIQMLLARPDFSEQDYACVRSIRYFGSPIGRELLNAARAKLQCELTQLYGASEAWILTALDNRQHLEGTDTRLSSCGRALPLVSVKIVNAEGQEVSDGTVGEVAVRTPAMFVGYYNQPEATREALTDGWYHTGDLGWRDDEGFFYLVDRKKDMIVSGGENIFSAEVEAALLKHPAVAQVGVVGAPDSKWGEKVVALVVLAKGTEVSEASLIEHCRKFLAGYKIPRTIYFEQSLPTTSTGKVQKATLRKRFRA